MVVKLVFALVLLITSGCTTEYIIQQTRGQIGRDPIIINEVGTIIRYEEFHMPELNGAFGGLGSAILTVDRGRGKEYYYQITKSVRNKLIKVAIPEDQIMSAFDKIEDLRGRADEDDQGSASYIEQKYQLSEGFQLGFVKFKSKTRWYVRVTDSAVEKPTRIIEATDVQSAMLSALRKIKTMKETSN